MESSRSGVFLGSAPSTREAEAERHQNNSMPCKLSLPLNLFCDAAEHHQHHGPRLGGNMNSPVEVVFGQKRDMELGTEEEDGVSWRNSDEGPNSNVSKKLRLTKAQSALLEESFRHHSTLNPRQKQELARDLKLRPRQVEVWFQNRRARTKLKQTETHYEYLKQYCATLTEENRWLHKELQILRMPQQQQQPVYMCPCCQRIAFAPKDKDNDGDQPGDPANATTLFNIPLKHPQHSN